MTKSMRQIIRETIRTTRGMLLEERTCGEKFRACTNRVREVLLGDPYANVWSDHHQQEWKRIVETHCVPRYKACKAAEGGSTTVYDGGLEPETHIVDLNENRQLLNEAAACGSRLYAACGEDGDCSGEMRDFVMEYGGPGTSVEAGTLTFCACHIGNGEYNSGTEEGCSTVPTATGAGYEDFETMNGSDQTGGRRGGKPQNTGRGDKAIDSLRLKESQLLTEETPCGARLGMACGRKGGDCSGEMRDFDVVSEGVVVGVQCHCHDGNGGTISGGHEDNCSYGPRVGNGMKDLTIGVGQTGGGPCDPPCETDCDCGDCGDAGVGSCQPNGCCIGGGSKTLKLRTRLNESHVSRLDRIVYKVLNESKQLITEKHHCGPYVCTDQQACMYRTPSDCKNCHSGSAQATDHECVGMDNTIDYEYDDSETSVECRCPGNVLPGEYCDLNEICRAEAGGCFCREQDKVWDYTQTYKV